MLIDKLLKDISNNILLPRDVAYKKYAREGYWPPTEHNYLQDSLLFHADFLDKMSRCLSLAIEIQTIYTESGILYEKEICNQKENNKEECYKIRESFRDTILGTLEQEESIIDFNPTTQIP